MIGSVIDKYKILKELGEGGMGKVYLAEHVSLGKKYALKVLFPRFSKMKNVKERFLREARAQALLEHPNLVQVVDYFEYNKMQIIVSKYIEGPTLSNLIEKKKGAFSVEEIIGIMEGPIKALNYAHSKGVIHRDIKPSNILTDKEGKGYITDFGIARLIGTEPLTDSEYLGTPHYMSPEQSVNPSAVDHRSDIYSIGCILYEMASGQPPFGYYTDLTAFQIIQKHVEEPPKPLSNIIPSLPRYFVEAVEKCLAKKPEGRFDGCGEILKVLKEDVLSIDHAAEHRILKTSRIAEPIANELTLRKSKSVSEKVNYDVRLKVPLAVVGDAHKLKGRATMKVNCEGLEFNFKSLIVSLDPYFIKWTEIHELKNNLRDKKYFKLNMGKKKEIIIRKVKVLKDNIDLLSDTLDSLPDGCYSFQCPNCDGYVINDLCRKCGTKPSAMNRREGVILLIIGVIIWLLLYFLNPEGHPTIIHKGFALIGLAAVIRGLYKIILGKRI